MEQQKTVDQMSMEELKALELQVKAALFDLNEQAMQNRNNLMILQAEIAKRGQKVPGAG